MSQLGIIQLPTLFKRIASVAAQNSSWIVFSIILAKLLVSPDAFGQLMIFVETAFVTSIVLLLGQDRLIIILLSKFLADSGDHQNLKKYSSFVIIWLSFLLLFLICSMIAFYFIPKDLTHPIMLGICFAPYFSIFEAASNLLNVSGRPIFARCIEVVAIFFLAIPLLMFYDKIIGEHTFISIAYIMAIFYGITALVGTSLGIRTLIQKSHKDTLALENATKTIGNYNFYDGLMLCIKITKASSISILETKEWLRQGIPLGIARLSDNFFSLAIPFAALLGVDSTTIAYASAAYIISSYNAELSMVIRNHFVPIILTLLPQQLPFQLSKTNNNNLCSIIISIWALMLASSLIMFIIGKPLLATYGPTYFAALPMLLLQVGLTFLKDGWSFNRSIFTMHESLLPFLRLVQSCRLAAIIILLPLLIQLAGIYGAFIAIGIPALLGTATQLWYLHNKTGLNLLYMRKKA